MRALFLTCLLFAACGSREAKPEPEAPPPEKEVVVGGDRDEHGCIGSAGYSWCAKEKACVRPWETAAAQGFDNNPDAFAAYCGQ